jgi:threonine dehydrogenase-like Zn-dependent dehydrogenase
MGIVVRAITVRDRAAGATGLTLPDVPHPHVAENDVIVRVHAAGFTPGELDWPGTWTDRSGRDRAPSVPGHELSGVVTELGYGTTGLTVGQPAGPQPDLRAADRAPFSPNLRTSLLDRHQANVLVLPATFRRRRVAFTAVNSILRKAIIN